MFQVILPRVACSQAYELRREQVLYRLQVRAKVRKYRALHKILQQVSARLYGE